MRVIQADDIIKRRYSIKGNEVIEQENGEYFSKEVAKQVLVSGKNQSFLDFDQSLINQEAIKFCRKLYNELLLETNMPNVFEIPQKYFEIFLLNVNGGKTEILKTIHLINGENKELYYKFEIASKIHELLIDIHDSSINEFPEIESLCRTEIIRKEDEIKTLKKQDEEAFEYDSRVYEMISNSSFKADFDKLQKEIEGYKKENKNLSINAQKNNESIMDLSKKLKIALDWIEKNPRPKTFMEKLKYLLKIDKLKALP